MTDAVDGKIIIKSVATDNFDGDVRVSTPTNLFDGKASIGPSTVLFDGKVAVPLMVKVDKQAWQGVAPAATWSLPESQPRRDVFIAVLRKTGFDDVEVPMSSLQLRRRNGEPTMISAIVPDAMTYFDYADDREGGEIIIFSGSVTEDGTRHLSELERATLETISYDRGVENSSLTIGGYRTETNENPRTVTIAAITYDGLQADGKRRVRGKINIFLRPGDTAIVGAESFTVEQIYITVEPGNAWMEVAGL